MPKKISPLTSFHPSRTDEAWAAIDRTLGMKAWANLFVGMTGMMIADMAPDIVSGFNVFHLLFVPMGWRVEKMIAAHHRECDQSIQNYAGAVIPYRNQAAAQTVIQKSLKNFNLPVCCVGASLVFGALAWMSPKPAVNRLWLEAAAVVSVVTGLRLANRDAMTIRATIYPAPKV